MSTDEDPAAWLRALLTEDLAGWRSREAAYLPGVPREGEWLWARAREQADRAEMELAILDEHASDGDTIDPECARCAGNHPYLCECGGLNGRHWRTAQPYPCRTVRLLLRGYQFRPGFREEWKL